MAAVILQRCKKLGIIVECCCLLGREISGMAHNTEQSVVLMPRNLFSSVKCSFAHRLLLPISLLV